MFYAFNHCKITEVYEPEHIYIFSGPCIKTGEEYSVSVKAPDLYKYHQGEYIQNAFPYLSTDDREFLMSGYSPKGWKEIFGNEEEEEDA